VIARHLPEEGRPDEITIGRQTVTERSLRQQRHARLNGFGNELAHPFVLFLVDDGTAVEIHLGRTDPDRAEPLGHQRGEFVVDAFLHQQAAAGRACLAGILRDGLDDHRQRLFEIGIFKHDLRRLAAEFEYAGNMIAGGRFLHHDADFRRTGEGGEINAGMAVSAAPASWP